MRIRQVKPAFWTDGKVGRLPAATRLFYIGTWMLADDAGWFEWDTSEIGAALYPFESVHVRERRIAAMGAELVVLGSIVVYECGHAHIPHLIDHQHLAGATRRVETTWRAHQNGCPASPRGFPRFPASYAREVRLGKVSKGLGIPAEARGDDGDAVSEPTTKTKFSELVPRPPAVAAGPRQ